MYAAALKNLRFFRIHSSLQGLWRISSGAHIYLERDHRTPLRALAAVFGLSSFGFEEYLKEINNMYCYLSLTHLWNLLCNFGIFQN